MAKITVIFSEAQTKALSGRTDIVRGGMSETIREGLDRYLVLLSAGQSSLKGKFTAAELTLLVDISSGSMYTANNLLCGVCNNARDTGDEYYSAHNIDRTKLLAQLGSLTPAENAALVDAIERYWIAAGAGFTPDTAHLI